MRWGLVLALLAATLCAAAAPAAVAAPAWLPPQDLSAEGQDAEVVRVAVDPEGNATAVWSRSDGTNYIIQSSTRPAGGAWSTPVDLSEEGRNAFEADVAIDPAGNATAVWYRDDGSNLIVQSSSRPAGGSWSAPVDLSVAGRNAYEPKVAVDPAGNATAVWYRDDGSNGIVQSSSRPAGGSWSAPVDLSVAGEDAYQPDIAVDPEGNATAVWRRYDGSKYRVQSSTRPAGGAWSAPVNLSVPGQHAYECRVVVDSAGTATAVWQRSDGSDYIVQSSSRPAGGSWSAPVDLSVAGRNAYVPDVAVDPAGNATAAWYRYDGSDYIVQSSTRPAGGTWSAPVDLSALGGDAYEPDVAVDPAGNATTVWYRSDGSNEIIQSSSRPAGGAWSAPVDLSAVGGRAVEPYVAVDREGNATAVWYRDDGSNEIAQAAGYDASGPQLRSLSIPTGGTAGQPVGFSVSPFDVWSSLGGTDWDFGDGGSASGTSVSHTYAGPGTYSVTVTGTDALGNSTSSSGTISIAATAPPPASRSWIHPAGLRRNLRNGTAVLFVKVSAPGRLVLSGRGIRRLARGAKRARQRVRLPIRPKVRLRRYLKRHRKARVRVRVTFRPYSGAAPKTLEKRIVLKRKKHRRRRHARHRHRR